MNVNNEVIWQQAEVLAKSIDEAYKNREKIDTSNRVGESLIHAVNTITLIKFVSWVYVRLLVNICQ